MTPETHIPGGEELKACGFCQSEALNVAFIRVSDDMQWSQVECHNCGAHGPHRAFQADAIADWNRRPTPEDAPQQSMSKCSKCGARYPSAPAGNVHKCGQCSGGYCQREDAPQGEVPNVLPVDYEVAERANRLWGQAINGPHVAVIAAALSRLSATPPPVAASEPVAFLYESEWGDKELLLGCNGERARRLLEFGWTETPLYALSRQPEGEG